MTIGISKEYLESIINEEKYGGLLSKLISKCTELDPWLPIETAPKNREILIYFTGGMKAISIWFNTKNGGYWHVAGDPGYLGQPIHYKELPEDPK